MGHEVRTIRVRIQEDHLVTAGGEDEDLSFDAIRKGLRR